MKKYKVIAIYAGSFDPVHDGHLNILKRSKKFFDKVICAVGKNSGKNPLFSLDEKLDMLHNTVPKGVKVDSFDGLLVDYVEGVKEEKEAKEVIILRGTRLTSDYDYEDAMFFNNNKLEESVDTLFLPAKQKYLHINSKVIRDVAKMNPKRIDQLDVPKYVKQKLKEKYG